MVRYYSLTWNWTSIKALTIQNNPQQSLPLNALFRYLRSKEMCFFVNRYIDPYSLFKCLPSIEGKKRPLKVIFLYDIHFAYLLFRSRPRLHFYGLSYRERKVTRKLYNILPEYQYHLSKKQHSSVNVMCSVQCVLAWHWI